MWWDRTIKNRFEDCFSKRNLLKLVVHFIGQLDADFWLVFVCRYVLPLQVTEDIGAFANISVFGGRIPDNLALSLKKKSKSI